MRRNCKGHNKPYLVDTLASVNQPYWKPGDELRDLLAKNMNSVVNDELRATLAKLAKPNESLQAEIAKAARAAGVIPVVSVGNLEWAPVQQAISDMVEANRKAFAGIQAQQAKTFDDISRMIRDQMPANLRDVADTSAVDDIAEHDGIPLAHVPRGPIVEELIACPDYEARRAVIANRVDEIVEDCLAVLAEPLDDADDDAIRKVALQAVRALGDGHAEAAQSLAVLASEQYISDNIGNYNAARTTVNGYIATNDTWFVSYYNFYVPLFIVPSLYTPWKPTDNVPPPKALSRHVTVHQVTADHLNPVNAAIAVLQVASLVGSARWLQEFDKAHPQPESAT